jgi:hypothetical protein
MPIRNKRLMHLVAAAAIAGTCFQLGGCMGGVANYIGSFNPCGTLLYCDPATYRFAQADYEGPGVDPDLDLFCTWPGFCEPTADPLAP